MYTTTIYDLAKDCNMMLDKNLIDCFEEIPIESEQLEELIENYNSDQTLTVINIVHNTKHNLIENNEDILKGTNNEKYVYNNAKDLYNNTKDLYKNRFKKNNEKLNKNEIHNYVYHNNENEVENSKKQFNRNGLYSRSGKYDTQIERNKDSSNRRDRTLRPTTRNIRNTTKTEQSIK
jgi:hypothetical protein